MPRIQTETDFTAAGQYTTDKPGTTTTSAASTLGTRIVSMNKSGADFDIVITAPTGSTPAGTVVLQRSHDNGVTWTPVQTYSSLPFIDGGSEGSAGLYRFYCQTYTSGPIRVVIEQ